MFKLKIQTFFFKLFFISWLERFIEDGGMQIIAKELGSIHKKQDR
jgi:hypothetical protein